MNTSNQSNFPEYPTFEGIASKLKTVLDSIRDAVAEGALHVREYATWQAEPIDFALAPNLVRHKAKKYLADLGQQAEDEEDADKAILKTEQIPNNGLYTTTSGFKVRILKSSEDGSVPPPGISVARQNFYKHNQGLLDFPEHRNGNNRVQPIWNLIIHWSVDRNYDLLKMSIALPYDFEKNDVLCKFDEPYWTRPPQAAVTPITQAPVKPVLDNDLNVEEEREDKTGTGEDSEDK